MAEEKPILKYVAIGCGVFLLLAVTCGGFGFYACQSCVSSTMGQTETAEGFLLDLRGGNVEGAYARMSPRYRAENDLAAFQEALTKHPTLAGHGAGMFNSFNVTNEGAVIGGMLSAPDGQMVPVEILLVEGSGGDESFVDTVVVNGFVFAGDPARMQRMGPTPMQGPGPGPAPVPGPGPAPAPGPGPAPAPAPAPGPGPGPAPAPAPSP